MIIDDKQQNINKEKIKHLISKIELKMKKKSGNYFWGRHVSVFKGRGMNFKNLRQYQYGDDVRSIDWKVTARSGRAHVREFDQESEIRVHIVFDTSSSMYFGHEDNFKMYKAYESVVVLTQILIDNGDKFGLIYHDGDQVQVINPQKGEKNLMALMESLGNVPIESNRKVDLTDLVESSLPTFRRRGGVVLISDFLQEMMNIEEFRKQLMKINANNDVFLVQILDPYEMRLTQTKDIYFEDLESGIRQRVNIKKSIREEYENRMQEQVNELHLMLRNLGIKSTLIMDNQDVVDGMLEIFDLKKKIKL